MIKHVKINNFKRFGSFELDVHENLNVIVGDNETGKSTVLEAINLALTGRLNHRGATYELNPYIFNKDVVQEYIDGVKQGRTDPPPTLLIEVYFKDDPNLARLKGTNNSIKKNLPGIKVEAFLNKDFSEEYKEFVNSVRGVTGTDSDINLPTEYYTLRRTGFDDQEVSAYNPKIKCALIDAAAISLYSGVDQYIQSLIAGALTPKEKASLTYRYRNLTEDFWDNTSKINPDKTLLDRDLNITDKELTFSMGVVSHRSWATQIVPYLDKYPLAYVGRGEQSIVKTMLALKRVDPETNHVVLIEEPENHLSYSNMQKLVAKIEQECKNSQLFVCTHSSYVLNKLGLDSLILMGKEAPLPFNNLPKDTVEYFKKLPGYNTLRLVLASRVILVEGASDDLVVQRAYHDKHGCLPLDNGVDVISVGGLSFKHFLEIAGQLGVRTAVVIDNDGSPEGIGDEYGKYPSCITPHYSRDPTLKSLEDNMLDSNSLDVLNGVLGKTYQDEESILRYMRNKNNKTDVALKIFETTAPIEIPEYIKDAVL